MPYVSRPKPSSEEYYIFAEEPSDDFFCPVMMGLLLQPHLTSCCGKHLSQEAATRIQREGKPCPLCGVSKWSTLLNKHFRQQVKSLRVYCNFKEKGCKWQGYLSELEHHCRICSFDCQVIDNITLSYGLFQILIAYKMFHTECSH